jgi:hypothetical protein
MTTNNIKSIGFKFRLNSRITSPTDFDSERSIIDTVEDNVANDRIEIAGDDATVFLDPTGYHVLFSVSELSVSTLKDRFETALGYLHLLVEEEYRQMRPIITLHVGEDSDLNKVLTENEPILREFGDQQFEGEAKREILQTGTQAKLSYSNTVVPI